VTTILLIVEVHLIIDIMTDIKRDTIIIIVRVEVEASFIRNTRDTAVEKVVKRNTITIIEINIVIITTIIHLINLIIIMKEEVEVRV
jgi:hypothetical protein